MKAANRPAFVGQRPQQSLRLQISDWFANAYRLRCRYDPLSVDAVVSVEIRNGAGLPEALDPQGS
ncbi:hypothetical protein ABID26_003775, partial [Mesorhizobium shonense]